MVICHPGEAANFTDDDTAMSSVKVPCILHMDSFRGSHTGLKNLLQSCINGAGILAAASTIISTFALAFVAEWGDKSFFSTIALAAAASSPLGVVGGALAGHGVATLLAVLGGSLLGRFLSEKVIAYIGGTLFLVFAAVTLIEIEHSTDATGTGIHTSQFDDLSN